MPIWRLQASFLTDTAFPKDRMVITPHFDDAGALTNPQGLCTDLAAGLDSVFQMTGEVRVKAYDAQGTPPVYPQGEAVVQEGVVQATSMPRELAVCLSFFSERNIPGRRGRLFIPAGLIGATAGLRPASPLTRMQPLVDLLTGLGGADVDWVVFSRRDNDAFPVTHWWYDNEWDVQRSRGIAATTRVQGTTTEA